MRDPSLGPSRGELLARAMTAQPDERRDRLTPNEFCGDGLLKGRGRQGAGQVMLPPIVHADPGDETDYHARKARQLKRDVAMENQRRLMAVMAIGRLFRMADPHYCQGCHRWNRGTALAWGMRLCGRASCLRVGLRRWRDAA